ncbi:MAG: DUF3102 domain-containing protein [Treponema sp.]|jgi:hypothetical protein|nr:DUF3102 domain-containing protein [Treponema sp.]
MAKQENALVKIEGLTAKDLAANYRVESVEKTENEIRFLDRNFKVSSNVSLIMVYEMGKRLHAMRYYILDHGMYPSWVKQNFNYTPQTAARYEKLFLHYRANPRELLEKNTVTEAYIDAGIKKIISADNGDESPPQIAGKPDPKAEKARMLSMFKKPTLSGAKLENHRVDIIGGTIYVYRKDVMATTAPVNLYFMHPPGLPNSDWLDMQKSFVVATELYLEKVEEYEAQGRIEAPLDKSIPAVMKRIKKENGK